MNGKLEINIELQDTEWPFEYVDHDREIVRAIVFDDDGYYYLSGHSETMILAGQH